ncbi:MAG TPA: hypothetical protein VGB17_16755 [Pyrinomonadaceae bacterium]|jgi:hypothetical protein
MNKPVILFILISIVAAVVALGAYQVVIHKYYWGPQGPPKKNGRTKKER